MFIKRIASSSEFSPRPMHWHRSIELTYLYKSACEVWIDGEKVDINDDEVYFINSGSIHYFKQKYNMTPSQYRKELRKSHF